MTNRSTPPEHSPPISSESEPAKAPRWETVTMALCFVALWAWWLARQAAYKTQSEFSPLWNVALGVMVALLVWIFVRRLKRTLGAIRELNGNR